MLRGIYSAATTMDLSMQKMNLFAQNLSNSHTTGYKKKTYNIHSFKDMVVNVPGTEKEMEVATGSYMTNAGVDQKQGRLKQTGNALDLAIRGEGKYFQLQVNQGENDAQNNATPTLYTITRNGNFMLNKDNYVVNANGDFLLDTNNQKIRLLQEGATTQAVNPNAPQASMNDNLLRIDQFGDIRRATAPEGSAALARVKVVEWTDDRQNEAIAGVGEMKEILKKYGLDIPSDSNLLNSLNPLPATNAGENPRAEYTIQQGYLETSNVDVTSSIISLMLSSKDYGMSQKLIAAQDKILDKTINEMGRLQ